MLTRLPHLGRALDVASCIASIPIVLNTPSDLCTTDPPRMSTLADKGSSSFDKKAALVGHNVKALAGQANREQNAGTPADYATRARYL